MNSNALHADEVKRCSSCLIEKPLGDFYAQRRRNRIERQSRCKTCANSRRWESGRFKDEDHRTKVYGQNRQSYERHKATNLASATRRRLERKVKALEYKGWMCVDCDGKFHPAAMDFHHRDPAMKSFDVGHALGRPVAHPWADVLVEIDKCDLLCSNCHRQRHFFANPSLVEYLEGLL